MMNLKVRLKQKWFWITLIPLLFLLWDQLYGAWLIIQSLTIGEALSGSELEALALKIIGVIFSIIALLGFPVDMTVDGWGDSIIGLERDEPAPNASQVAEMEYENKKIEHAMHADCSGDVDGDDYDD